MINLLTDLTEYLGQKLSLVPGTSIFYNSLLDKPDKAVLIESGKFTTDVLPQIDASVHYIRVVTREKTSDDAYELACDCYKWLLADTDNDEETGFITLTSGLSVYVQLHGVPLWDKTDQQGRRYYYFTATMITKRIV